MHCILFNIKINRIANVVTLETFMDICVREGHPLSICNIGCAIVEGKKYLKVLCLPYILD